MTDAQRLQEIQARKFEKHHYKAHFDGITFENCPWCLFVDDKEWLLARVTMLESEITHRWKEDVRSLEELIQAREARIETLEAALQMQWGKGG